MNGLISFTSWRYAGTFLREKRKEKPLVNPTPLIGFHNDSLYYYYSAGAHTHTHSNKAGGGSSARDKGHISELGLLGYPEAGELGRKLI